VQTCRGPLLGLSPCRQSPRASGRGGRRPITCPIYPPARTAVRGQRLRRTCCVRCAQPPLLLLVVLDWLRSSFDRLSSKIWFSNTTIPSYALASFVTKHTASCTSSPPLLGLRSYWQPLSSIPNLTTSLWHKHPSGKFWQRTSCFPAFCRSVASPSGFSMPPSLFCLYSRRPRQSAER
jgi:hypothetical protein